MAPGRMELCLGETDGDPVLSGNPLKPCFIELEYLSNKVDEEVLTCQLSKSVGPIGRDDLDALGTLPNHRMLVDQAHANPGMDARANAGVKAKYPKHVFMMSRGTRGDIQPFVALARGLCNELGWLVTICTEKRWKPFVISKCADITNGYLSALLSGDPPIYSMHTFSTCSTPSIRSA